MTDFLEDSDLHFRFKQIWSTLSLIIFGANCLPMKEGKQLKQWEVVSVLDRRPR